MKRCILLLLATAGLLANVAGALGQTVTIYVWLDDRSGTIQPADKAMIYVTPSLRLGVGGRYLQKLEFQPPNKYVASLNGAPASIDVGVDHPGYHSLPICDLSGDQDHTVHVRLLSRRFSLAAPECFALKTQYEFLFRKEQQLAGREARRDRASVEHSARLKYADGLLALPNPNRPKKTQSRETQAMLERMEREDEDGYSELENMLDGLFDLYHMDGFQQYVPSKWKTHYWAGENRIEADVEILGTHGTYRTAAGLHRLENIDFVDDNENGGYFIAGNFRFKPGTPEEKTGSFRWKVDEQGFRETRSRRSNGEPSWIGTLQSGPYFPEE